jgi:hypothetical protein
MNNNLRNLLYWLKRFVFDTILKRYTNIDIQVSDKDRKKIIEHCIENELSLSQFIECSLKAQIKNKKELLNEK